ncbi:PucR family transcriptional regulator [Jatrophihabitans sp.]|uniref:PucR family transcriptional regulator n=1 Tax=Jatrophihabitans sp. TaxID=1932789 RepID=UPI002C9C726C|nr:helix-turn-helix domain-containing protein [Jatrophihabitans sp.]
MTQAHPRGTPRIPAEVREAWLAKVAADAARQSGTPAELLGAYLDLVADAALTGRTPDRSELAAVRELGRQAAASGVAAHRMAHLYLTAAARLWSTIPQRVRTRGRDAVSAAAEAVLVVVDGAVAALVEGHESERRRLIRNEESVRRQFIDDLLRGDSDVASLVQRSEPFGLDFGLGHQVALAVPNGRLADHVAVASALERSIADAYDGREVLVDAREGRFVVVAPEVDDDARHAGRPDVGAAVQAALGDVRKGVRWRIAAGRAHPGAYGVARSYEEAREALDLAEILQIDAPMVYAHDLLVYRVLVRDQAAISDLVQAVLSPLTTARGGAGPLLDTLQTYFETGGVATEAARRLHVSVRTVTYRLAKVAELTGRNPTHPGDRLALEVAVLGARLLQWPQRQLPSTE